MIRPAKLSDIPELVKMLIAFREEAGCYLYIEPNPEALGEFISAIISSPENAGIAVCEKNCEIVGTAAVLSYPHWFNTTHKEAQELWWYIKPEFRGSAAVTLALYRFIDKWPREHGCKSLIMASTANLQVDKLGKFYEKRGAVAADIIYSKVVN